MSNRLTDEVKRFVVQSLAAFWTPGQVVKTVKEEFDLVVTPQQVQFYDPTKSPEKKKKELPEKWHQLFSETREKFLKDKSDKPISFEAYRLARLQRMSEIAESRGNFVLAANLLEQAAKECGGMYTNSRRLKIDDGAAADLLNRVLGFEQEGFGKDDIAGAFGDKTPLIG